MNTYVMKADGFAHIEAAPKASLVYTYSWTDWMNKCGITAITTALITPDPGLTLTGGYVISGGLVAQRFTIGSLLRPYKAVCRATFNTGESDERTVVFDVRPR
jgi:hypothetical protein